METGHLELEKAHRSNSDHPHDACLSTEHSRLNLDEIHWQWERATWSYRIQTHPKRS